MMQQQEAKKVIYNAQALVTALKTCSTKRDLQRGKELHALVVQSENDTNIFVMTELMKMYAKCGNMADARQIFDGIRQPDVVSWTVLLLGYADNGEGLEALELFSRMKAQGCVPDSITYVAALKACTSLTQNGDRNGKCVCLERGTKIHAEVGGHINRYVQNILVDMYGKCGKMVEARRIFDSILRPDVVSWNALLLGYAENGEGLVALEMFSRMKTRGFAPDTLTYAAAIKACTSLAVDSDDTTKRRCLERGRNLHSEIGVYLSSYVQNTLITMYAKCGSMVDARGVFECIRQPETVCWNALISGYAENGKGLEALEVFSRMKESGYLPDSITYVAVVRACTCSGESSLERGRKVHTEIGRHMNTYIQSALVDMYAKCRSMVEARRVFESIHNPDVVCWTALLLGYADNDEGLAALKLFSRMKASGCTPDSVAYLAALRACTSLAVTEGIGKEVCLQMGRDIHRQVGGHMDRYLLSALVDMYAKCGSMVDARFVFDNISKPDVICWTALLMGYVEHGEGNTTLELFSRMKLGACTPDSITYTAAFKACGLTGDLALGRKFHSEIRDFPVHVVTCLVDFYAKCGSMVEARDVFESHAEIRDVATWNALLTGYGSFDISSVFELFDRMQDEIRPDAVTFVCILLCCSHAGLVEKAKEYVQAMPVQYGVFPTVVHYNCVVDGLSRTNQLNEALALLRNMPCNPNAVTWRALLGACRKWKNVEIGRLVFESLVSMDRESSGYVLMAQIYGSRGMWEEQERVLKTRFKFDQAHQVGKTSDFLLEPG